jgi:hypothetical protein
MSESKKSVEIGRAFAEGFRRGIERSENATEEEKQKYFEEVSKNRSFYEMMRSNLLCAGYEENEIMSFEEWSNGVRNLSGNIKHLTETAKQARITLLGKDDK